MNTGTRFRKRWLKGKLWLPFALIFFIAVVWWYYSSTQVGYNKPFNWEFAGGSAGQTKYSPLDQVNKGNVSDLKVAWIYHSGNMAGNVQCNPLIINGIMYVTTPAQELVAVNAANGKEIWRYNPSHKGESFGGINRGIAYWKSGNDERIFFSSANYLNALDTRTGKAVASFGNEGRVNLNKGLVRPDTEMSITSPAAPVIFKDMVIVGALTWSAPSNVSAFDIITGKKIWTFNTIPQPGEYGYDTWGNKDFWKKGAGINVWGGLCVDEKNGLVFFATGQPKDDFYRANNVGAQLFGNCIIALNASTGKRVWHYQAIHHDIWDLDLPCPPILVDLRQNGKRIPGVMQLSKTGNIFLFNRLSGEVLSKVVEKPVPGSDLPGEFVYPTQPYVSWPEPFSRQVLTENDLTNLTPEAHEEAIKLFSQSGKGWFLPPSINGILYYGIHGGAEWAGGAYDEEENTLFINANELAWNIRMKDINAPDDTDAQKYPGHSVYLKMGCTACHGANREGQGNVPGLSNLRAKYSEQDLMHIINKGKKSMPAFSQIEQPDLQRLAKYLLDITSKDNITSKDSVSKENKAPEYRSRGYVKFLDKNGYPATKPPWGTLNAIDLNTGKIKWKVPLGEYEELSKKGIPVTGTENFGGCIVTGGGLVFIGATRDRKFRAFDKETGKVLWESQLPYGGYANPSTYAINGKQYIVIPATGGGKLGAPAGDAYVAFALPGR